MIKLEKINAKGKKQIWIANVLVDDLGKAEVIYRFGQENGKMRIEKRIYLEGKNLGKANETTPSEQALNEVVVKVRKKIANDYKVIEGQDIINDNTSKTAVASCVDEVPAPMLAKVWDKEKTKVYNQKRIGISPKKDGNRLLVHLPTGKIYSRSRKEVLSIPGLGEAIKESAKNIKDVEWLDGELFSSSLTFNEMQSIIRKKEPHKDSHMMNFNCFDAITDDGFEKRYEIISKLVESNRVKIVPTYFVDVNENIDDTIKKYAGEFVNDGDEGAIVRLLDKGYENKRSVQLLKVKTFLDAEFKVVGWNAEKNDSTKMGSAILENSKGENFSARPAMTAKEKAVIWANKEKYINKKATVKFFEYTEVGGEIPRFPVLIKFRAENDLE